MKKAAIIILGLSFSLFGCQDVESLDATQQFIQEEHDYINSFNHLEDAISIRVKILKFDKTIPNKIPMLKNGDKNKFNQLYLDDNEYLKIIDGLNPISSSELSFYVPTKNESSVLVSLEHEKEYIESIENFNNERYEIKNGNLSYGLSLKFDYNDKNKTMNVDYKKSSLEKMEKINITDSVFIQSPHINSFNFNANLTLNKNSNFIRQHNENEYVIINFKTPNNI